eukprot:6374989-Prymnesium_polylepis.2
MPTPCAVQGSISQGVVAHSSASASASAEGLAFSVGMSRSRAELRHTQRRRPPITWRPSCGLMRPHVTPCDPMRS